MSCSAVGWPFAAALAAAGCVSTPAGVPSTGVVVGGPGLVSTALEAKGPGAPTDASARPTNVNPASVPDAPWVGAIGLRSFLPGDYEVGFGVFLPDPLDESFQQLDTADQVRTLGVGFWLELDF